MSRIAIGCALLLLGRAAAASGVAAPPPTYDSFQPPPMSASYADPAFGTSIKRLSNSMYMSNNAAGGTLTSVSTEYSTASPFNRDNTWLILQHSSYFGLYNGSGDYLRDLPFAVNASSEPRWSRTDPNALFYVSGNKLMKLDVVSGVMTLIRAFSEYGVISGKGESDISGDGDHFVFAGDNRYVFVYQISTGLKGQVLDTIGHAFDQLYIASNGSVALGWIANGTSRFTGVELFDANMRFQRQLTHAIGHMRLTRDTNGDDVLVWTNSNDAQPIPNCQNGIVKVRLQDARQTCLLELDWSLAVHITAADADGWSVVETYAPSDPSPAATGWAPYTNEILRVKLDGTETRRLLHHRSRPVNSYEYQPRAALSRDGTKLVFTSNYNLQALLGYPKLYTDAYLASLPAPVAPEPSTGVVRTVCASGCTSGTIQSAINASAAGDTVWVKSTYDSTAAGEVFPIQTLALSQNGSITITGETNAAGSPITTVRTRSGPTDGFNITSPGSVVKDLRIVPGDATRVNRVITAARHPGSCPGATCHLNGLTIQNVVIDFSTTFNAGNAIDLSADNVLIDKVTIKGIAGNSILVDGDNYTIRNSTLDGRDGAAIRGALAIGFAADKRGAGVACSGFPTNYAISANTIVGYGNGIRWCSGRNNTVSNNTITDISGKGIDTSGSRGTQIVGNTLQNNTTGATHGIGLSNSGFQTCTTNTVRNNKILGRALRDTQRGIVVQGCVDSTIFQNEVRNFADNGGAIYATMTAGVATKTTIQGNTVIGGDAAGIVYLGADRVATGLDQSVIRDNVVNDFKRNGIVVQFVKGVRTGASAGNVVAYNTVRAVNLGLYGNTHAFNLQNLANTAFDRNTALDTRGGGIGFFLANSTGVNGNCNTGSTNGGGLFAQVNVTPTYGNSNVNCRVALYSHYDFDGDGKSDVTMYRHTTGQWFTKNSSNGADIVLAFGNPGSDDIPAPGNYTAMGKTDRAIYRYSTGEWYIRRATDGGTTVIPFGSPLVGDVPMPADYDGDGITDLAVFRTSTANAEWYIRRSSDGQTQYVAWGCAACADLGVPGDYDGDGKADVAVYRRSTGEWFIRNSGDTTLQQVPFGVPAHGDIPVPGRYTQASKTDMAVYRSLTGDWLIRRSTDLGTTTVSFGIPSAGDFPVSADFTMSGITDIAIYRPTPPTAAFLIRRSTNGTTLLIPYGNPGSQDAPLAAR